MKKIIFIIPAIFLLSGCPSFFNIASYREYSDKYNEVAWKCRNEIEKKYANDHSEGIENKKYFEGNDCISKQLYWWEYYK